MAEGFISFLRSALHFPARSHMTLFAQRSNSTNFGESRMNDISSILPNVSLWSRLNFPSQQAKLVFILKRRRVCLFDFPFSFFLPFSVIAGVMEDFSRLSLVSMLLLLYNKTIKHNEIEMIYGKENACIHDVCFLK